MGREVNVSGAPHRFYCVTCGCSLYTVDDLNRGECEGCLAWLDRIVRFAIMSTFRRAARGAF